MTLAAVASLFPRALGALLARLARALLARLERVALGDATHLLARAAATLGRFARLLRPTAARLARAAAHTPHLLAAARATTRLLRTARFLNLAAVADAGSLLAAYPCASVRFHAGLLAKKACRADATHLLARATATAALFRRLLGRR